jgi:hypothetical protein
VDKLWIEKVGLVLGDFKEGALAPKPKTQKTASLGNDELQALAGWAVAARLSLQECVSEAVASYMKEQGIGFNELTRRLQTSTRHTSRLLKGEANLTMGSVAELAALMKKKPRIIFE